MNHFATFIMATLCGLVLSACGGGGSGATHDSNGNSTPLAPPAVGFQLQSTSVMLAAGEEQYLCWSMVLPASDALSVIETQPSMPMHVHHYAVFTKSGAVPAQPAAYDCHVMDATWGLVSGGGQTTPGLTFPSGTAMKLAAGTQLVLQLHLLNTSSDTVTVSPAAINLVGSTSTTLTQVGLLIGGTLDIDIPAHMSNFPVSGGCASPYDMPNIFALFPHMHQLGTHIDISLTPQGTTSPTMLLSRSWDFGNQGVYATSGSAKKGDQIGVQCTYDNTTDAPVTFGESTTQEMCLGVLFYWPIAENAMTQYCGLD
jgi:hypothetical protein